MKNIRFNIWHFLLLLFVSAGLLYITRSWLMSLGIMLLLLLIDQAIVQYEGRKNRERKDEKE